MKKQLMLSAAALTLFTAGVPVLAETAPNGADVITVGDKRNSSSDAVDVASWQSWMKQTDFDKLKQAGVKTIIVKATEGTTYTNPYMKSSLKMARQAGLNVAIYHYSQYRSQEGARAEAKYLVKTLQDAGLGENTLVFNDLEDANTYKGLTKEQVVANTNAFFDELFKQGYSNMGLYTFVSYPNRAALEEILGKEDTWLAQYPFKPTANNAFEIKHRNDGYGAWQFSSSARIQNGSTNQLIDVSKDYNGLLTSRASLSSTQRYNPITNQLTELNQQAVTTQSTVQEPATTQVTEPTTEFTTRVIATAAPTTEYTTRVIATAAPTTEAPVIQDQQLEPVTIESTTTAVTTSVTEAPTTTVTTTAAVVQEVAANAYNGDAELTTTTKEPRPLPKTGDTGSLLGLIGASGSGLIALLSRNRFRKN